MVVKSVPVVEAQAVSGGAPLVRKEGGPGSGRRPSGTAQSRYEKAYRAYRKAQAYVGGVNSVLLSPKEKAAAMKRFDKAVRGLQKNPNPNPWTGKISEVTPPGYENIVKGLKKHGNVDNPWAVAWAMKSKGIKPKTSESAPVASGQCHDELAEVCNCPDCMDKKENGVPSQLLHDETPKVPVKSFRDDIKRKVNLRKVMGKHEPPDKDQGPVYQAEATFVNPPGPIPKPFKKNSGPDEVVGDYAPGKRYKTVEAVPSSFNDDPAGMDDTSDLDLGMLDPDDNEEIPSGDDQLWTKEQVNYRYSGDKFESCGNCVHFKFPGACAIIAGPVRPVDVCDKFEAEDEDKGTPFGWENPPENEAENAHSVNDQTVPSTLVPLKDKEPVPSKIIGGAYGGFGKSYGMITTDTRGGDAFGRRGSKNDDAVKSKRPSFGPASSWGMVTKNDEGGPGSGRVPGVHVNGVQKFPGKEPHVVFTDKVTKSTMLLPQSKATPENMQNKAVAKRREFYGDPTERRQAMKKSFASTSESEAVKALANRLAESAFDTLKNKLAQKKGIYSPGGLAAKIGRDKYGKAGMVKKAAAGRRKTTEAPGEFMPVGPSKTAGDASGKMSYEPTQRNKKFKGMRDSGKKVAPEA